AHMTQPWDPSSHGTVGGVDSTGRKQPLLVNTDGSLVMSATVAATVGVEGVDGSTQASAANPLPVAGVSGVSSANSSAVALGGGATFTGTSVSTLNYGSIAVSVFADQASATDGLSVEQSSNGTNWDITDTFTIPASTGRPFVVAVQASFARVRYTNGATPQ